MRFEETDCVKKEPKANLFLTKTDALGILLMDQRAAVYGTEG